MKHPDDEQRLARRWPVAAVVLFFPLVGGLVALSGTGSTQAAQSGSLARAAASAPPAASAHDLVPITADATAESVQIVSSGGLKASGVIESTFGGFRFPDGSVQTTAASGGAPITTGPDRGAGAVAAKLRSLHPNVVVVDKAGTGYPSITSAIESISDAGPAKQYVVYVAPGTYREQVRMKPHVVLEGAGEHRTKIVSSGGGTGSATVVGAVNATLRRVSVENTGGGDMAVAISSPAGRLSLSSVRAWAHDGARSSIAIAQVAGSMDLRDVTAEASGGEETFAVRSEEATTISLSRVSLRATGATRQNVGLSAAGAAGSKLELTDVDLEASGAARFNTGALCEGFSELFLDGARSRAASAAVINEAFSIGPTTEPGATPARIMGLWATATGGEVTRGLSVEGRSVTVRSSNLVSEGTGNTTGLWVRNGIATGEEHAIRLLGSTVVAGGQTVWSESPEASVAIGHSTLEGGPVLADRGEINCAATIDEEWGFHAEGCP